MKILASQVLLLYAGFYCIAIPECRGKALQELSIHRWTMCPSCSRQREVTRAYNVSDLLYILLYIFFNSRSRLESTD